MINKKKEKIKYVVVNHVYEAIACVKSPGSSYSLGLIKFSGAYYPESFKTARKNIVYTTTNEWAARSVRDNLNKTYAYGSTWHVVPLTSVSILND